MAQVLASVREIVAQQIEHVEETEIYLPSPSVLLAAKLIAILDDIGELLCVCGATREIIYVDDVLLAADEHSTAAKP